MTQDTRKDRRVKIVSLNVRYKSATVDEFIENHSHDVSKGGIFIKTASPFPPGTLLKFEIRLAGDQAVIAGVGRVVWKRESAGSTAERPAGMGVKFIKIDDASKATIDKLVSVKADAGKGYESEQPVDAPLAASSVPPPGAATTSSPPRVSAGAAHRKATMMGLGTVSPSSPPAAGSQPPVAIAPVIPAAGSPMFPETNSKAEMPPKQEQTVMKQAAELLEEALKEAGGSMEEIGNNPLFEGSKDQHRPSDMPTKVVPTMPLHGDLEATKVAPTVKAQDLAATVPDYGPTPAPKPVDVSPPMSRESPSARSASPVVEARAPRSEPPPRRSVRPTFPEEEPKKKGGSSGIIIGALLVLAAGGVGAYMFKDKLFGTPAAPTGATQTTPPPATTSAPTSTATATTPAVDAAATTTADAGEALATDAAVKAEAAAPDAGPATTTTAPPTTAKPQPPPPPTTATPPPPPPTTAKPPPPPPPTSDNPY